MKTLVPESYSGKVHGIKDLNKFATKQVEVFGASKWVAKCYCGRTFDAFSKWWKVVNDQTITCERCNIAIAKLKHIE